MAKQKREKPDSESRDAPSPPGNVQMPLADDATLPSPDRSSASTAVHSALTRPACTPHSRDEDDGAEYTCAVCSGHGPFSKRQKTLADMGNATIRCTKCIEGGKKVALTDNHAKGEELSGEEDKAKGEDCKNGVEKRNQAEKEQQNKEEERKSSRRAKNKTEAKKERKTVEEKATVTGEGRDTRSRNDHLKGDKETNCLEDGSIPADKGEIAKEDEALKKKKKRKKNKKKKKGMVSEKNQSLHKAACPPEEGIAPMASSPEKETGQTLVFNENAMQDAEGKNINGGDQPMHLSEGENRKGEKPEAMEAEEQTMEEEKTRLYFSDGESVSGSSTSSSSSSSSASSSNSSSSSSSSNSVPLSPSANDRMDDASESGEDESGRKCAPQSRVRKLGEYTGPSIEREGWHAKRRRATHSNPFVDDEAEGFSDGCKEDEMEGVSLNALKRKILGRDLQSSDVSLDGNHELNDDDKVHHINGDAKTSLKRELSCAICHEILYQPISLLCGHSFCKACLNWWLERLQQGVAAPNSDAKTSCGNCPTCRRVLELGGGEDVLGVNTALRACVESLFGDELRARIRAEDRERRIATAGEGGGAHTRGYEVLSRMNEEPWKILRRVDSFTVGAEASFFTARRSIVLDTEDQRMQLALALRSEPRRVRSVDGYGVAIELCLLSMEEDEASDGGFPLVLREEDDDHLICTENRLLSCVEANAIQIANDSGKETNVPLLRMRQEQEGNISFDVDSLPYNTLMLSFRHEISGAELEIKLPDKESGVPGSDLKVMASRAETNGESSTRHSDDEEVHDSEEDMDQFEEDGFLVPDSDHDDGSEDDQSCDHCCLCDDGGELLVCDGGDYVDGCGRNFHLQCIKRDTVPPGDWICEQCGNEFGVNNCGIRGHEFPCSNKNSDDDDNISFEGGDVYSVGNEETVDKPKHSRRVLDDSSEGESCDHADGNESDGSLEVLPPKASSGKQRTIIVDSDED